ncbi:MAG: Nif3-like dinuclear metal center hexameric protein [Fimbriimonadaceae bacterium]|nr:Nif3-like dinuclear metal center hexameric protein [Fimbriimonadaceae bacterium]QYK55407.1 MAG: Nif3-like dinuclear metal center hexameric protein [Fimbriimonadaceae bacterium]
MATVGDVEQALESLAPSHLAFDWDHIGLQVGDRAASVTRVVVSLDSSTGAAERARQRGAQMLVSHHPLVWKATDRFTADSNDPRRGLPFWLAREGIAFAAAHTNWDCATDGLNDELAERLRLRDVQTFGGSSEAEAAKLVVYSPESDVDALLDALAAAGAGEIGAYKRCAFMAPGRGTFWAGPETNPTIGKPGEVEVVEEVRIETVFPLAKRREVEQAVVAIHSYEEPAFDVLPLTRPTYGLPMGRWGRLPEPMGRAAFRDHVDACLGTRCELWCPEGLREIATVAVVGGGAGGEWRNAVRHADAYLTGEVRQDEALSAVEAGLAICAAGHYATEQPGVERLARRLAEKLPEIEFEVYAPEPGTYGRPL